MARNPQDPPPVERASPLQLEALLNAPLDSIALLDRQGRILTINESGARRLGSLPEELIGRCVYDLLPPEAARRRRAHIEEAMRSGRPVRFEDVRSGSVFANSVYPMRAGPGGQATGVAIYAADITESRQLELELLDSEKKLRTVIECASIGIVVVQDERAVFGNARVREILGFEPEYGVDLDPFAVIHPEDREASVARFRRRMAGEDLPPAEIRFLTDSGVLRWVEVTGVKIEWEGRPALQVFFQDITERKLAELNLREALAEIEALRERIEAENVYLREQVQAAQLGGEIVAESPAMKTVVAQAQQVAPTDSTVLILGETGTGKELLAREIHAMSGRRHKPLVVVNCAAMPTTLVESELFGREKGAYTGAQTTQVGRFEIADGGSLFLDEIGELPAETQAKLLRVLQDGSFERLGNPRQIKVDVRLIVATNRDLAQDAASGHFRRDLYYRLNVFPITLPPLRERPESVPALVEFFVREFAEKMGKRIGRVAPESLAALQAYPWPGNVRELRNVVERAMIMSSGRTLRIPLPASRVPPPSAGGSLAEVERQHILAALKRSGWRVRGRGGAAEALGLKPTTLEARMKKHGVRRPGRI